MVIEPKYEKVTSSTRVKLGTTQAVIDVKLPTTDGLKVSKVLCANAKAVVLNAEVLDHEVKFGGNVAISVVYIDETNTINGMDYTAEFNDKFDNLNQLSGTAIVSAGVVDVKSEPVDNEIKISVIVELDIDVITSEDSQVLVDVVDNSVFVQKENIQNTYFLGEARDGFEVTTDVEIKDSVQKILSVCISPMVEKVLENDNYFTVYGGLDISVCYLTDGEMAKPRTHQFSLDFNHDIAIEGATMDSIVQTMVNVDYSAVKITTSLDSDSALINMIVPVNCLGYVFNKQEIEIVSDVFSTENYLNTAYNNLKYMQSCENASFVEKINGGFSIDENQLFVDDVLGTCCNNVIVASSKVDDGNLVVEGVAYTTVVYFNKEFNSINSVEVEMPFSISKDLDDCSQNYNVQTILSLGEVVAKCRRGKDIEISANLNIFSNLYKNIEETVIESVEVLNEKESDELVLNIYIVKDGETIWDIAKFNNVSPDMVLEQNPEIELPLKAGDKLVIYKQKIVEF